MKLERIHLLDGLYVSKATPQSGCKEYVVFVHGGPGSHSAWFELVVQEHELYRDGNMGWVFFDQNGCGRTEKRAELTHAQNIEDLRMVCNSVGDHLDKPLTKVFGHSYGARLAYETFLKHPEIKLWLVLAGRSIHGMDSMNQSTLMDLYILQENDPEKFRQAYDLVAQEPGHACEQFLRIRKLLPSDVRSAGRRRYYWGNHEAMHWYEELKTRSPLQDNDDVFEAVRHTYFDDDSKIFDPGKLSQPATLIKGFWDFIMAGSTCQGVFENVVTFNGSGHYPHLEEPKRFLQLLEGQT